MQALSYRTLQEGGREGSELATHGNDMQMRDKSVLEGLPMQI
jgi:hypothetical protein